MFPRRKLRLGAPQSSQGGRTLCPWAVLSGEGAPLPQDQPDASPHVGAGSREVWGPGHSPPLQPQPRGSEDRVPETGPRGHRPPGTDSGRSMAPTVRPSSQGLAATQASGYMNSHKEKNIGIPRSLCVRHLRLAAL